MALDKTNPDWVKAEDLNQEWADLTDKFDAYYNGIAVDVRKTINQAISDWQDYYFGQAEKWTASDNTKWEKILAKTGETLSASIKPGTSSETKPVSDTDAPKTNADTVFYVQGNVDAPPIPDVVFPTFADLIELKTPKWLFPVLIGVPSLFILYQMSKPKKRSFRG